MSEGKRLRAAREKMDREKTYGLTEAVKLVKESASAKFDETVELHLRTGADPRHADQQVRGVAVLPHGVGKRVRVVVFTDGEAIKAAEDAGADAVGNDDLIKRIEGGWTDFDVSIATPGMMSRVGRLGRILGRRGLMPNPKVGTVTTDVETAVKNAKSGQVRYRTDKAGIIHCAIGRADFEVGALQENLEALLADLKKAKPASAKGSYFKKLTVSSTMGPGISVDRATVDA